MCQSLSARLRRGRTSAKPSPFPTRAPVNGQTALEPTTTRSTVYLASRPTAVPYLATPLEFVSLEVGSPAGLIASGVEALRRQMQAPGEERKLSSATEERQGATSIEQRRPSHRQYSQQAAGSGIQGCSGLVLVARARRQIVCNRQR